MRAPRLLFAGASLATIAVLCGASAQPAHAEGFLGTPTTVLGAVTFNRTPPTSETITIDSARATINWAPNDTTGTGPVVFLPTGNSVTYVAGTGAPGGQYTVLNRIIPTDPTRRVDMNGLVTSAAGGSLWFYAPGGILLGSTAQFNVGSLLLTAGDPRVDANGNFLIGNSFGVVAATDSTAGVTITSGAQINALNENSYVVAVAPKIQQNGAIAVNGSAALVSAEVADFTYNAGLFDITVTQGASVTDPFVHTGSTTGPASSVTGDYHRIYMVAIPKNTAMSMFIQAGGAIGFDIAGAADLDGNAIVLSAGHNVVGTTSSIPFAQEAVNATVASMSVDSGSFTSAVTARATTNVFVASLTGNTSFASEVRIRGDVNAHINARNGHTITIAGSAAISADASSSSVGDGAARTAGFALLNADTNATLTLMGTAFVSADATGNFNSSSGGAGGDAFGGRALISVNSGGSLSIGGNAFVSASALGGFSFDGVGGNALGGQNSGILANGGGTLSIAGGVQAEAVGRGGPGGSGTGGRMDVNAHTGSTLNLGSDILIDVSGFAGDTEIGPGGGAGTGGFGTLGAGTGTTNIANNVDILARGVGGDAQEGNPLTGAGTGGTALINTFGAGGLVTIGGASITLDAGADGGSSFSGTVTGGAATGGVARISPTDGTIRTTAVGTGSIDVSATALGGEGATGGAATGGTAGVSFTNGTFSTSYDTFIIAQAFGGEGLDGNGGAARGGTSEINIFGTSPASATFDGAVTLAADASGADVTGPAGAGGAADGGIVRIAATAGTITVQNGVNITTTGLGGSGTTGGNGIGGTVDIFARDAAITVGGLTEVQAFGAGGDAFALGAGAGGSGTGGNIDATAASGVSPSTLALGQIDFSAFGFGGTGGSASASGGTGGRGGDATGGRIVPLAQAANGRFTADQAFIFVAAVGGLGGTGGEGGVGGAGGNATGGFANFGTASGPGAPVLAGYNRTSSIIINADGIGGTGGAGGSFAAGGAGGSGAGGSAVLIARGSELTSGSVNLNAQAFGGAGGIGSGGALDGRGGDALNMNGGALIFATPHFVTGGPATVTLSSLTASANATGGSSGTGAGGNASGGWSGFSVFQHEQGTIGAPTTGSLTITGDVQLTSSALGGTSTSGAAGNGTSGNAQVRTDAGSITVGGNVDLIALATGGATTSGTPGTASGSTFATGIGGSGGAIDIAGNAFLSTTGDASIGVDSGTTTVDGDLSVFAARNVIASLSGMPLLAPGLVQAGGGIQITSGGSVDSPVGLAAQQDLVVDAGTTLRLGNLRGEVDVDLVSDGNITTGNISAGDSIAIDSSDSGTIGGPIGTATVATGNLDAGILRPSSDPQAGFQIGVAGAGNVAAGSVNARGNVGFVSFGGSVTTGAVATTRNLALIAATAVTTGAVSTGTSASDAFYIGNPGIFASDPNFEPLGPPSEFDFSPFFANPPLPVAGNVLLNGAVTTGQFVAASTGSFTATGAISATGNIDLQATGAVVLGDLSAGNELSVSSMGAITTGNVRGEDDIQIDGGGTIQLGNVSAGGDIDIASDNGTTAGGTVTAGTLDAGILRPSSDPTASYAILVGGTGATTLGAITARGPVGVLSRGGTITTGAIAADQFIGLLAGGNVATGGLRTSATGTTIIANDSMVSLVPDDPSSVADFAPLLAATPVRLPGSLTIGGAVDTGVFKVASTGNFTAQSGLKAANSVSINSGGVAGFNGIAEAPQIDVRSADIAIGASGGIGSAATAMLNLTVDPVATAIGIGGNAASGWSLDTAEVGRLRARRIVIAPLGTAPPVIRIGSFTLTGSAGSNPNLIGTSASFVVSTPGSIQVTGAASVANAAATDTLQLLAGPRIDVLTDMGGALRLADTGGAVSGLLDLTATDVLVASAALASQLASNPSFPGRDAALGTSPAAANPAGFLGAGRISVSSGNSVLIQNSGSLFERAGFTAGAGGFRVVAQNGTSPIDVVINGRIIDAGGTALINERTVEMVSLQPSSSGRGFTMTSSVNGCVIGGMCLTFASPVTEVVEDIATTALQAVSEDEERKVEEAEEAAAEESPQVRIERLVSTRALNANTLVDEPVTSGGNSSLWIGGSEPPPPTYGTPAGEPQ